MAWEDLPWLPEPLMLTKIMLILMLAGLAGFMPAWGPPGPVRAAPAATLEPGTVPRSEVERLEQDFKKAVARAQPLIERYGYPVVFFTILVEGAGIPAPGQTILIAAALSAAHGHLSILWVMILAYLGAGLGNSLGYLLGRWGGRALLARFKVRGDHLARLEELFRRYGGGLVLVARFLDGLRQLNGMVAGMLAMPWRVFTGFNLLGALLWTGVWGLGTYWLDKDISMVHRIFARIGPFAVIVTLVGFLALLVYLFYHRQTQKPD
jgi:membrane protein DedA with SNARE-associated domain